LIFTFALLLSLKISDKSLIGFIKFAIYVLGFFVFVFVLFNWYKKEETIQNIPVFNSEQLLVIGTIVFIYVTYLNAKVAKDNFKLSRLSRVSIILDNNFNFQLYNHDQFTVKELEVKFTIVYPISTSFLSFLLSVARLGFDDYIGDQNNIQRPNFKVISIDLLECKQHSSFLDIEDKILKLVPIKKRVDKHSKHVTYFSKKKLSFGVIVELIYQSGEGYLLPDKIINLYRFDVNKTGVAVVSGIKPKVIR
jgi:hypothetical protein